MMNPDDKQNVSLATQMLLHFSDCVEELNNIKEINFRVCSVAVELHLLKYIIDGILVIYAYLDSTIQYQLEVISKAAHILFVMQHNVVKFLPNQLYHDLQATFEDSFYSAVKWQIAHRDIPLYLMLLGNDTIERVFGNIRLKYKHNGIDSLEIINAAKAIELSTNLLEKHSSWTTGNRSLMKRLCLDYSNQRD